MLDPALLREHSEIVRTRLEQRGISVADQLEFLGRLDSERREILPVLENARHERKALGGKIAKAKKEGLPADELLKAGPRPRGRRAAACSHNGVQGHAGYACTEPDADP